MATPTTGTFVSMQAYPGTTGELIPALVRVDEVKGAMERLKVSFTLPFRSSDKGCPESSSRRNSP